MESLLKAYQEAQDRMVKAEADAIAARAERTAALKAIVDAFGVGPHEVDGESKIIVRGKGDAIFFKKFAISIFSLF